MSDTDTEPQIEHSNIEEKDIEIDLDALASPNSEVFKQKLQYFKDLLRRDDLTFDEILSTNFSPEEIILLTPATLPHVKAMQNKNADLYTSSQARRDFVQEESQDPLAWKLTLRWFGHPTECIKVAEKPTGMRWESLHEDPLAFLSNHENRNWGVDARDGNRSSATSDKLLELYGRKISSVNGSMKRLSREERAEEDYDALDENLEHPLQFLDIDACPETCQYRLYGFQGVTTFESFPESFLRAIRRLLSLNADEEAKCNLLLFSRSSGKVQSKFSGFVTLEGEQTIDIWKNFLHHADTSCHDELACFENCAWFITLESEVDPPFWQPLSEQLDKNVARIVTSDAELSACYLAFPELQRAAPWQAEVTENWNYKQFQEYVQTAFDVLASTNNRKGFHKLAIRLLREDLKEPYAWQYGLAPLLPHDLWMLHPLNPESRTKTSFTHRLEWTSGNSENIFTVLHGYYPPTHVGFSSTVFHTSEKHDVREFFRHIAEMLQTSLGDEADTVTHVGLVIEGYCSIIFTYREDLDTLEQAQMIGALKQSIQTGLPLVVRPIWGVVKEPVVELLEEDEDSDEWKCRLSLPFYGSPLSEIFKVISAMGKQTEYLKIRSVSLASKKLPTNIFFETHYVGPHTTNEEWNSIRLRMPTRCVTISSATQKGMDWLALLPANNIWGPRYGSLLAKPTSDRWSVPTDRERVLKSLSYQNPPIPRDISYADPKFNSFLCTSDKLPMISRAVLTPTEQIRLQHGYLSLHQLLLKKPVSCWHSNCDFKFCPDEMHKFELHQRQEHGNDKCPWCPEHIFEESGGWKMGEHLKEKHWHEMTKFLQYSEPHKVTEAERLHQNVGDISRSKSQGKVPAIPRISITQDQLGEFTATTEEKSTDKSSSLVEKKALLVKDVPTLARSSSSNKKTQKPKQPTKRPTKRKRKAVDGSSDEYSGEDVGTDEPPWLALESQINLPEEQKNTLMNQWRAGGVTDDAMIEIIKSMQEVQEMKDNYILKKGRWRRRRRRDNDPEYVPGSDGEDSEEERERAAVLKKLKNPEESAELTVDPIKPQDRDAHGRERRPMSPDWNDELGSDNHLFVPEDGSYCSKCIRKMPKASAAPKKDQPSREEQIAAHTDQSRCCRIRSGAGSTEGLPNRSGWIREKDMRPWLQKARQDFANSYPAYANTMYPLDRRDARASNWRSDPNNESNKEAWSLSWPPLKGEAPIITSIPTATVLVKEKPTTISTTPKKASAPPTASASVTPTITSRSARKKRLGPKNIDGRYVYASDEDSADELRPDVDDINPKQRKAPADPSFRPQQGEDEDVEMEDGGSAMRSKLTVKAGRKRKGDSAMRHRKGTGVNKLMSGERKVKRLKK